MTQPLYPKVSTSAFGLSASPELPGDRARRARVLEAGRHLPGLDRRARPGRERLERVRLLRRPSLRQRPAPLRSPPHRIRQGRRAAVPDDAGQEGRPPVRLGHPRPARRTRSRTSARHHRQVRDRPDGTRRLQRRVPCLRAALHEGVGGVRHPPGTLGRLRQRLQDARRQLHGERHLGVQAALGQGPRLRGLPRPALLLEGPDPALEPRVADGRRRLQDASGPGGDDRVQALRRRRMGPHLDDDPVDGAVEPGRSRQPGDPARRRRRR